MPVKARAGVVADFTVEPGTVVVGGFRVVDVVPAVVVVVATAAE
jgi:multidrug resistance efflux pump